MYMIWKGKADIWFVNLTCKRDQGWFCCIHHFRYRAYPPRACRPPPQSAPSPGNLLCERLIGGRCTSTETTKIASKQNRGRWSRNSMTLSCLSPELVFFVCLRVVLAEILLFRDLLDLNRAFLANSSCYTVSIRSVSLVIRNTKNMANDSRKYTDGEWPLTFQKWFLPYPVFGQY